MSYVRATAKHRTAETYSKSIETLNIGIVPTNNFSFGRLFIYIYWQTMGPQLTHIIRLPILYVVCVTLATTYTTIFTEYRDTDSMCTIFFFFFGFSLIREMNYMYRVLWIWCGMGEMVMVYSWAHVNIRRCLTVRALRIKTLIQIKCFIFDFFLSYIFLFVVNFHIALIITVSFIWLAQCDAIHKIFINKHFSFSLI